MTVYLLWFINFHSERELVGVFSSRESAEAFADAREDLRRKGSSEIDETVVDQP